MVSQNGYWDELDIDATESAGGKDHRVRFDVSPRRQYFTEARHRRGSKQAVSRNGVHRRRNKRNGL